MIFQHTVPRCCQYGWQWNPIMFLIERQSISVSESQLILSDKFRLNLHPMYYRSYIFLPSVTYGFTLPQGDNRWGCAMDFSLGHVPAKCPLFTRVSTTSMAFISAYLILSTFFRLSTTIQLNVSAYCLGDWDFRVLQALNVGARTHYWIRGSFLTKLVPRRCDRYAW